MKFSIHGFDQAALVALGLDITDATILRWFVDFQGTGRMKEIIRSDGERFWWVKYQSVMDDLPVLGIQTTDRMGRRFGGLVEKGVLVGYHHKMGGSFSTFKIAGKYELLLTPTMTEQDYPPTAQKQDPYGSKTVPPYGSKAGPKDSSIRINSSIRNSMPEQVLAYLNERAGTRFRTAKNTGLADRIKEGYVLEDFKAVIDCKIRDWKGTEFEKYIAPDTLFRPSKFEKYLREAGMRLGVKKGKFGAELFDGNQPGLTESSI